MNDVSKGQVAASAAEIYDTFFIPALFGRFAPIVAEAARIAPGDRVLDIACGTGVLAREALQRTGRQGTVTGLDCNPGMLAVARRTAEIDWREGTAEALPFADASFDRVLCQFGLMFFQDRTGALNEMRRVVRPGGRIAVAVWASLEETPGYAALVSLLRRLFDEDRALPLTSPYCLGDPAKLAALFAEAGMGTASIALHEGEAVFPSIHQWIETDVKGWTLGPLIDDAEYSLLQREAATALSRFAGNDGQVRFRHPALVATVDVP